MRFKELFIATQNQHKIREIRAITEKSSIIVRSLADMDYEFSVEEDCRTLEGNAIKKALRLSALVKMPCFADDSGLFVKALDDEPGVHSARFMGKETPQRQKNEAILRMLADNSNRRAAFKCIIALVDAQKGFCQTFYGECRGTIAAEIRGYEGFGYDPIFIPEGYEHTFGELPAKVKNSISHRARALLAFQAYIRND